MSDNLQCAYIAAKEGNMYKLLELLNSDIDVNYKYDLDWTLLHLSAQYGHVILINELLKYGADIDSKSKLGYAPLHDASFFGHKYVVRELLMLGANANTSSIEGFTPLHLVAWNNSFKIDNKQIVDSNSGTNNVCTTYYLDYGYVDLNITKELLKYGADINFKDIYDNTALHYASRNGHVIIATELLNNGADVNIKNKYDITPLHYASISGHANIITELVKHGAVVNFNYKNDYTPLHYASINGHVKAITELLKHGADVNLKIRNDNTPLHCASRRGQVDVITELIKNGAHINLTNIHDNTALYCASKRGYVNVVTELLKHGAVTAINLKNKNFNTPLHRASDEGHIKVIAVLLKHGADVNLTNKYPGTPLHCASEKGHLNVINMLIEHMADVNFKNEYDNTGLHCAAKQGHLNVITKLLHCGADVNFKNKFDNTPLHCASEQGHIKVLMELVKYKADVNFKNKYNNTPLHCAVEKGHLEIVTELLKHKVDVNSKNEYNNTPLHCASRQGNINIVIILIKQGTVVNFKNEEGDTPLHCASIRGHANVVTELLKCGADVNLKNKYAGSPLHCASEKGHVNVITELLRYGADVNIKNRHNDTPVHFASLNGHLHVITELIRYGAEVNVKNKNGETPLYFAALKGNLYMVNELQKNGAVQNISLNPFKTHISLNYEIIYDNEHVEVLKDLQEKILKIYIFNTLSEHEISQNNLKEILSFFNILFPNARLSVETFHSKVELFDLEILHKLLEYNFYGEYLSASQKLLKTDNQMSNPFEINLPGIGKISCDELIQIANQSYDLSNNFVKNFWPDFKNLFKSVCIYKSDEVQKKVCEVFGNKFTNNIRNEIEMFVKDDKTSSFFIQKLSGCDIFSDLQHTIVSFEIQKLLTKLGAFITGTYMLSKSTYSFPSLKPKINFNILFQENTDLPNKLFKLLVQIFIKPFKYPYVKVVKTYENLFCPDELKIQGSGCDGFLIYGKEKSDLDFIFTLKIFNSSLKFHKLIECPNAPAHVRIEVTPYFSECRNKEEKYYVKKNAKLENGIYYLNIKHIKQLISEYIKKELINYPPDYLVMIESENENCFRIQFTYNVIPVMINHLTNHILQLTDFSENFAEIKVGLKRLLNNISGIYYVSQLKWEYFQTILKLYSESLHQPVVSSSSKTNDFHIDLEIERSIKNIIHHINSCIYSLEYFDKNFIFLVNILEDLFYLLILILISLGINTVIPIFRNKSFFCSPLPSFDDKIKFIFSEKVFFTTKDIENILNFDLSSISTKEITPTQKAIEIYICASLIIIRRDVEEIFNTKSKPSNFQEFGTSCNEKFKKRILTNNITWHLSMINHVIELLEILKSCMQFNNNKNMNNATIIKEQEHTFDVVPCLKFEGWPVIASAWVTRNRFWPDSVIIDRIINNYFYVVFKSSRMDNRYDGRLSFSEVESILCHAMTRDQSSVYYFIKDKLKLMKSKHLTSYYIKTLCLWVFESISNANDIDDIQIKYIEAVINKLFTALQDHRLPHYFIPEHNLLINLTEENYQEINEDLQSLIENQVYEHSHRTSGQTYSRGDTTNIEFLFQLVEQSFYKSVHHYFNNF